MDDFIKKETIGRTVTDLYRVDEGHSPTMACLKTGKIVKKLAVFYRTHLGRIVNSIHHVYPILINEQVIGCIAYIIDFKNIELYGALFLVMVILGIILSWISTNLAVRKYLRMDSGNLY